MFRAYSVLAEAGIIARAVVVVVGAIVLAVVEGVCLRGCVVEDHDGGEGVGESGLIGIGLSSVGASSPVLQLSLLIVSEW